MSRWVAVPMALGAYVVGLALHELTHVVMCVLTGSDVVAIHAMPPAVDYRAPSSRADELVRVATVPLSLPLLVAGGLYVLDDPVSWRWLVLAGLAGYLPRSQSDWGPVASLIK